MQCFDAEWQVDFQATTDAANLLQTGSLLQVNTADATELFCLEPAGENVDPLKRGVLKTMQMVVAITGGRIENFSDQYAGGAAW